MYNVQDYSVLYITLLAQLYLMVDILLTRGITCMTGSSHSEGRLGLVKLI